MTGLIKTIIFLRQYDLAKLPEAKKDNMLSSSDVLAISANLHEGSFTQNVNTLVDILGNQIPFNQPSIIYNLKKRSIALPSYLRCIAPVYTLRAEAIKQHANIQKTESTRGIDSYVDNPFVENCDSDNIDLTSEDNLGI